MGRELKRVPLDFDAPLNKVWAGFINPHYKPCPDCENGYTYARARLNDLVSLIMISGEDSSKGKNHPYFEYIQRGVHGFNNAPSPDMLQLTEGLAGRKADEHFGHDACDRWAAARKIVKAAGLPKSWGTCLACKGDAIDQKAKKAYNKWKATPPPAGDGFQLWSTTSEGSPCSPVFSTLEALCEYAEDNCTTFATNKTTKENWMAMLGQGLVTHQEGNMIFL